jgi:hypothetical protein
MQSSQRRTLQQCFVLAALGAALLATPAAGAQEREPLRFRLAGVLSGGVRTSLTESWGQLDFQLTNLSDTDRRARVLAFYENAPDAQVGRDLWVPAHATVNSWLAIGPAPAQAHASARELQFVLQDLTGAKGRLVLPKTEERVRAGGATYRKRAPTTALVTDLAVAEEFVAGELPRPELPADEAFALARAFRSVHSLTEHVQNLDADPLPPWPRAFDGIDQLILASNRLIDDPAGMRALRHWLEQGGQVWVMLDRVVPEAVTPLLGEALDFEVVGRVSLTDFRIQESGPQQGGGAAPLQKHERPVDFARVLLPPNEPVRFTVDGWPVSFTRTVGRGKVLFTTLGPRGWYRPRTALDPRSPYPDVPELGVANENLLLVSQVLQVQPAARQPLDAFESLLTQEIGYAVVGRGTVMLIFAVFLAAIVSLSIAARRSRRPEFLGWVAPAIAIGAAGAFVLLGEIARRAAPPTVAVAQVIDAVSGTPEANVHGVLAVYRPDSGLVDMGAVQGGFFNLDVSGSEGQTRQFIMTDLDAWHWENLGLPAGVRFAPFQFTARTAEPIRAVASFGPDGIEGKLVAETLTNLGDGLVTSPGARNVAVRLGPEARFSAGSADALATGKFVVGTLLNDQQQRRQEIYRRFLKRSAVEAMGGPPVLMAWADPLEMPFHLAKDARMAGTALVSVPLQFERTPPDTRATIPGPFVEIRRLLGDKLARPVYESTQVAEQHLRFQLPASVLPLQVERARLALKIDGHARRITIAGFADGVFVELERVDDPLGPLQVNITEPRFLRLDADSCLHLRVTVDPLKGGNGGAAKGDAALNWIMEYLELEVVGRTAAK